MTLRVIRGALLAAPLLLVGVEAQAHAHLLKSSPAENAVVAAPRVIDLLFSERLEGKFSGADLVRADGTAVPMTSKAAAKSVTAQPASALLPGGYKVLWRAVTADGHKITGQYSFTVK